MVPRRIAEIERVGRYRAPLVMEGGSFTVDGEGTVITTEECLLSQGRNPHLTRTEIERYLCDYLNVDKVIWLSCGIDPRRDERARRRCGLFRGPRRGARGRHR